MDLYQIVNEIAFQEYKLYLQMTNISNIERVRHKFVGEKFHVFFGMRHCVPI